MYNPETVVCSWCGKAPEKVYDERTGVLAGICEDDGIVYLQTPAQYEADDDVYIRLE